MCAITLDIPLACEEQIAKTALQVSNIKSDLNFPKLVKDNCIQWLFWQQLSSSWNSDNTALLQLLWRQLSFSWISDKKGNQFFCWIHFKRPKQIWHFKDQSRFGIQKTKVDLADQRPKEITLVVKNQTRSDWKIPRGIYHTSCEESDQIWLKRPERH